MIDRIRDFALIAVGVILVGALGFITSCQPNPVNAPGPGPTLEAAQVENQSISRQLADSTRQIKDAATQGQQKTPPDARHLHSYWQNILARATGQDALVDRLNSQSEQLQRAEELASALAQDRDAQKLRAEKAEASARQALAKALNWLIVSAILGLGVCVVLLATGNTLMVEAYQDLPQGGMDITKAELFEISLVTIPANANANVLRQIKEKLAGFWPDERPAVDVAAELLALKDLLQRNTPHDLPALLEKSIRPLIERLDAVESSLVVLTEALARESHDRKDESHQTHLKQISERLEKLNQFIGK